MHDSKLAKETSPEEHVTEFQPMTWYVTELAFATVLTILLLLCLGL